MFRLYFMKRNSTSISQLNHVIFQILKTITFPSLKFPKRRPTFMKIGRDMFRQSMMLFCKNLNQQSSRSILHFFSEKLPFLLSKCQVPVKLNCNIFQKFKVGFKWLILNNVSRENTYKTEVEFPSHKGLVLSRENNNKNSKFC